MSRKKTNSSFILVNRFSKFARPLRQEFEQVFGDPNSLDPRRFCWDPWYVQDQYSQLRTPAYHFFSPKLYGKFHRELVLWGRRNLGCWDVSPPMLSLSLHGHFQNFHCD
ncbi:MAG: hypothetical protein WCH11_03780, partial [Bdellovibrio sp.]